MSETFKCCNCGFVCEIINSESLATGIAECEHCGMKGLRRQNPNISFVDSFRAVITTHDPQANSLMSKDMPPAVKILADWGRKACDELKQLRAELDEHRWIPVEERLPDMGQVTLVLLEDGNVVQAGTLDWNTPWKEAPTHWKPIILPGGE